MASGSERRICIYSQRAIRQDVSRCSGYEFEDVVASLEAATFAVPERGADTDLRYRAKRWLAKRTPLFTLARSGARAAPLGGDFELFGAFLQKPLEILELDALPDWRRRSKMTFCVLEELWDVTIDQFRPLVKSLDRFDLITCAFAASCAPLAELTGRPVIHLPGAADLMRFAPRALETERPIDVYYMGRRRPGLHAGIKASLESRNGFYLHDSATRPPIAGDHGVHREVLADLVRRSKIFMVDVGKIGHADQQRGQIIWGPRHVEGMAGGAIQAGYTPDSEDYRRHFNWPEAVERLPADPEAAAAVILALIDNPVELERRRRVNLAQALRRHDWLHRWQLILDHFGLAGTPAMTGRKSALESLAAAC